MNANFCIISGFIVVYERLYWLYVAVMSGVIACECNIEMYSTGLLESLLLPLVESING